MKQAIRSIDPKQINVDPIGMYSKKRMESVNRQGKKVFTKMVKQFVDECRNGASTNEAISTVVSMMANSIVFETFRAEDTLKEAKRFQKLYLQTLKENDRLHVRISKLKK